MTMTTTAKPRSTFVRAVLAAATLASCTGTTLDATVDRGPTELDRPTAWYPLNDAARIGHDRAAGRGEALVAGVQIVSDPQKGPVAEFDPVTGGSLTLLPPVSRDFTVAFWMKSTQQGPKQAGWVMGPRLIDGDYPNLALDFGVSLSLDKLAFGVGNPSDVTLDQTAMISLHSVVDGTWHHVAVTRDGTTGQRQIFVDGALDSEMPALPGDLKLPPTMLVGQRISTAPPSPVLKATLLDLRFYDRVLSAPAIAFLATP
ncbi:MAG TPA: LamG domain-containing protein [Polyangia bacterium]|jgi:hypothetical protein|nr:LamG domain-containing protein [Polyangia bacterium]